MVDEKYKVGTKLVTKEGMIKGEVVPNYKFVGDICVDWENGCKSSYDADFLDEIADITPD